jgi:1-acyl-sn-glycerol-3-phosphate acyltransferase
VSLSQSISALFLRITGWKAEGGRPAAQRFVLIAAPHTSNWDLAFLLAFAQKYGIRVSWMGKQSLFRGPMGWAMRRLGGIPVRRERTNDLVAQMADVILESDAIALTVPAEGTRGYTPHWKSGFYHIARTAQVPVVLGFLDYERRRGGFGPALLLTGDVRADMDEIRAFYADKRGRFPENVGQIRLKEEM